MTSRLTPVLLAVLPIILALPVHAASYNFQFTNETGMRLTRLIVLGEGEIEDMTVEGRLHLFKIVVPDGTCQPTLRYTFNDAQGKMSSTHFDDRPNLCAGENGMTLNTRRGH